MYEKHEGTSRRSVTNRRSAVIADHIKYEYYEHVDNRRHKMLCSVVNLNCHQDVSLRESRPDADLHVLQKKKKKKKKKKERTKKQTNKKQKNKQKIQKKKKKTKKKKTTRKCNIFIPFIPARAQVNQRHEEKAF